MPLGFGSAAKFAGRVGRAAGPAGKSAWSGTRRVGRTAGRGAGWAASKGAGGARRTAESYNLTKYGTGALAGGALLAGGVSGVLDKSTGFQQEMLGHESAVPYAFSAGIKSSFAGSRDVHGVSDYYYGRQYNPTRQHVEQVPGDIVFGAYNLRR